MAKFGSPTVVVQYDDAPGGTLRNVTAHVTSIGGVKIEQITEMTMPFGASNETHTPVGVQRVPDVAIEGFFDNEATTGPHAVFGSPDDGPSDATRTFSFSPNSGTQVFTCETRLVDYEVVAQNGNLTRYRATVRQAGAGAWATP